MGKMSQEMMPGRCREERHSPVGWLVLIVSVIGFGRDWWGIPLGVAERFPQRSNWKGKPSFMMDCDIPWVETWQSKRGHTGVGVGRTRPTLTMFQPPQTLPCLSGHNGLKSSRPWDKAKLPSDELFLWDILCHICKNDKYTLPTI